MAQVSLPFTLTAGQPENVNQLNSNLAALVTGVNAIDDANLTSALAALLGISQTGATRRGKSIIDAGGTRTNTAYGALSNGPDQVANVVWPANGLLRIGYSAVWSESVVNTSRAAIFIGANQLVYSIDGKQPSIEDAAIGGANANTGRYLSTTVTGLVSATAADATSYIAATTPQILGIGNLTVSASEGGEIIVFDPTGVGGTVTVSVQFKASSGTVTASNRKLWVEATGY